MGDRARRKGVRAWAGREGRTAGSRCVANSVMPPLPVDDSVKVEVVGEE